MFISLYTHSHLKQLKRNLLILGTLLVCGGFYAVFNEVLAPGAVRFEWLLAAGLIIVTGMLAVAVGQGKILLKDAYFSMNPSRVSYRLTLFGKEQALPWNQVNEVRASDKAIIFELRNERKITLRLSTIPDEQVARHIKASISLAALEQNIKVNGVLAYPHGKVAAS